MKAIRIITLFMASAAVAAITSCAKEEASAPEQEQISIIQADIVQPTDESATKTSLGSQSGDTYPVLWTSSDAIAVSNQSASGYVTYTTTADKTQSGTFTTSEEALPNFIMVAVIGTMVQHLPLMPCGERPKQVTTPALQDGAFRHTQS